jgi:D-amino peptidase
MPTSRAAAPRAPRVVALVALATCAALAAPAAAAAQQPLRVYISADMEGIAGAVTGEQLGPAGFEYQRFREFMTLEVLAAIDGARAAGATHITVSDSHGNGQNLLIERFPADVTIVRAWPRPLGMMEGIDSSFHAAVLIGYHASATNPAGVRAHTFSSARLADVALNGRSISESAMSAALAGHFGVPVVFISGDDVTVAEARAFLGDVEGAAVKRALGFHSAATLTPEAARDLIRQGVRRGVERRREFRPYPLERPVRLDVTFKNYRPAEVLAYLPIVERPTARSIRFTGRDITEIARFLTFMNNYDPGLEP